jgi:hypothetical protein
MGEPMDRSNRPFAPLTSFEKAFPTVESVTIASYEIGEGVYSFGDEQRNTFGRPQPLEAGLIRCSNPPCRRGGYEVEHSLQEMVLEKLTEKEFSKVCPGDEGSPKGRRRGNRCMNVLRYRLTVKYKGEGLSGQPAPK